MKEMFRLLKVVVVVVRRISMKHVKIGMVCATLLFFFVLLQMWRSRTHHGAVLNTRYRPGAFMKGLKPLRSSFTYCLFNYDLPNKLSWEKTHQLYPPEFAEKSPYRAIYNIIDNKQYRYAKENEAVTYVTHATPEYLYHVAEIARYWDGPISVAIFAPDLDFDLIIQMLTHLCRCYEGMAKVSVHLIYPVEYPPKLLPRKPEKPTTQAPISTNKTTTPQTKSDLITSIIIKRATALKERLTASNAFDFEDCSSPDTTTVTTFRKYYGMIYPINVARNVARNATKTEYFLVSDIEMVPSEDLATRFVAMVERLKSTSAKTSLALKTRVVFVVPVFQVNGDDEVPRNKKVLVKMIADNRASYFHQHICPHCQRFPGMHKWLGRPPSAKLQPAFVTRREAPYHRWEPLYFGTNREPWYSEALSWEGKQDKMTQMLEMCLMMYRMIILDGGFLCHTSTSAFANEKTKFRLRRERENAAQYDIIASRLRRRYEHNDRC